MATEVSDQLWTDFHTVVNMNSRELEDWLRTRSAGEETEETPDQAGPETGHRVLVVLRKRRMDLNEDDVALMQRVVDEVRSARNPELDPKAGDQNWRHRLMSLGHDPLKPTA